MYRSYKPIKRTVTKGNSKYVDMRPYSASRVKSTIEDVTLDMMPTPHALCDHYCYHSDIYLLLNQQRLDRMSLQSLTDYFNGLPQSPSSSLSRLRSKVSDSQLMQLIKSRCIQSASELMGWSYYITSQADKLSQDYKTYVDELLKSQGSTDPVDPVSDPSAT